MLPRFLPGALLILLVALTAGCGQGPVERTIDRFEELNALLEANKDDPETLLKELESWMDANAEGFQEDAAEVDAMSETAQDRLEAKHERELQRVIGHFMDVTAEIQDRLRDDPEQLARFVALLQRIE